MERIKTYTFITLSLIVLCGGISVYTIYRINFLHKANKSHEEILNLTHRIHTLALENEITMLSYGTTFDTGFLDSVDHFRAQIETKLTQLDSIVEANELEDIPVDSIEAMLAQRIELFYTSLEGQDSPEGYIDYIKENRRKNYLRFGRFIKNQTDAILAQQQQQIITRESGLLVNLSALSVVIFLITVIGIITAFLNFQSIARYYHSQQLANRQIQDYQEKLKFQIEQLNQTNHELEQFAYVASHDLQEPLRKITAFNDLLQEQYKDSIQGEGKLYLDRMAHAAHRMRKLITDLLDYSRAGRYSDEKELLDLNDVVNEVSDDLSLQILEKNASLKVDNLPSITAHYSDWRTVFQNLISNALKFSKPDGNPNIYISYEKAPDALAREKIFNYKEGVDYHHIQVTDNGIGFKKEYADRIFTIFQRLHGKDEYEGTGIGLAICKKIMERYEGTIFATSEEGKGSTFHLIFV